MIKATQHPRTIQRIPIDLLDPLPDTRPLNTVNVERLAQSIPQIGLQHPIHVIANGDRYFIVLGNHRAAATQLSGGDFIDAEVLPEGTTRKELLLRTIHENEVRHDETLAETIDRITKLMEAYDCEFAEAAKLGQLKGPKASTIQKVINELSPDAMQFVRDHQVGMSIAYEVARRTSNPDTQLDWLTKNAAGEMTRDDITSAGKSPRRNKKPQTVSLTVTRGEVTMALTMPKSIDYATLKDAIAHFASLIEKQRKRETPADLLPRYIGEKAKKPSQQQEVATCSA